MEDGDEWIPTRQGTGQGTPATVTPGPILQFTQNQYTPLAAAEAEPETTPPTSTPSTPATPLETFVASIFPTSLAEIILPTATEEPTVTTRTTIPQVITVPTTEEDNHSIDSPIQPVDIAQQYTTAPTTPPHTAALIREFSRLHHNPEAETEY